jgi:hypothetical protein
MHAPSRLGRARSLSAVLVSLLLLLAAPLFAASLSFTPSKDVAAKEHFPTTNYGADNNIQVSAQSTFGKIVYVQFTVSGIPAGSTGITAQLKLRSQTTGTGRSITAHGVSNTTWTETGLTWATKPALGSGLSTVSSHTSGVDSVWDVSTWVTGNGTFALGLDGTFSGDTTFTSKEGTDAPTLVVSYNGPAPSVSFNATDWTASEVGAATATIQVVSSSAAPAGGLVVKYALSGTAQKDNNANPAPDYLLSPSNGTATTGSVTIAAGATTASITLTPIADVLFEGSETAIFTLTSDPAYTIGAVNKAQVVIADQETAPTVNPNHASGDEGGWIVPLAGTMSNSECSGLVSSFNYPGVLWYQRDGTTNVNDPRERIYAVDINSATDNGPFFKQITINPPSGWSGAFENHQWEDMTIDPDAPSTIWIGDIGNNATPPTRTDVILFKFTEPDPYGAATSVTPTAYYLRYPGGVAANAEVLFVFEGLPHIILKESNPRIYRAPTTTLSTNAASPTIMEFVGNVVNGGGTHSVGAFSADRRRMVLSTHGAMWVYVSQSALDPANSTLTPAQAKTYIQDLLCTRSPAWAVKHNGGKTDPEAQPGSVEGGAFVGNTYDIVFGAEARQVTFLPAWRYETQPAPFATPPAAPTVNNSAPDVTLFAPAAGASFSKAVVSSVTLQALASDFDGTIGSVKFYQKLSGAGSRTLIGTGSATNGAYQLAWTISGVTAGTYTISADATDNSSAVSTHSYDIVINP